MRGRPAPKRPAKPSFVVLVLDDLLHLLPLDPEGRIGQQVVVALAGEGVLAEAVAEADVRGRLVLQHHVGPAHRVRLGVQLLAEGDELARRVELAQVLLGDREHAAGAAGGVEHGAHDARRAQRVVVLDEEEIDHQADDFARGEVLAGRLVGQLGELAEQLLVEVAHLDVGDLVGVQVDLGHLGEDEVEELGAVEAADLGVEVELLDDVARVGVEGGDPGAQVAGDLRAGRPGCGAGSGAGVVRLDVGDLLGDHAQHLGLSVPSDANRASTCSLVGSRTQSRRRSRTRGRMTFWYSARL